MPEHVLTVEFLATLIGILGGGGGIIWKLWSSLNDSINEVDTRINQVAAELDDYKLEVSKEYASIGYLKDVEERLVQAINKLGMAMERMPQQIADILRVNKPSGR